MQRLHLRRHFELIRHDHTPRRLIPHRIDEQIRVPLQQKPQSLQNAAWQVAVILLIEDAPQRRQSHHVADDFPRIPTQITSHLVGSFEVGDHHRVPQRAQDVDARQKIRVIRVVGGEQIIQAHLHQHHQPLLIDAQVLHHSLAPAMQHPQRHIRDRPEAAPLKDHRPAEENLGRFHHLALGRKHRHVRHPLRNQLQTHQPVIDVRKSRPGELDHVDLNPHPAQSVHQRPDQIFGLVVQIERTVDQVHAQNPQHLLLAERYRIEQPHVNQYLRSLPARRRLKLQPHPPMPASGLRTPVRSHRIGEREEVRCLSSGLVQPLHEQSVLVVQHAL
jgi:hypothetical protein